MCHDPRYFKMLCLQRHSVHPEVSPLRVHLMRPLVMGRAMELLMYRGVAVASSMSRIWFLLYGPFTIYKIQAARYVKRKGASVDDIALLSFNDFNSSHAFNCHEACTKSNAYSITVTTICEYRLSLISMPS